MSFMVENIFPSSDMLGKESLKLASSIRSILPKFGVVAGEDIPCGAQTKVFNTQELGALKIGKGEVIMSSRGYLEMREHGEITLSSLWRCSPNFSPDIHSCNIQIDIFSKKDLDGNFPKYFVLKATKNIQRGCELFLWFSEEVSAMLNMPFLTPKNITGHRRYSCHLCCKAYETPNPLKIHLLLSCESESMAQLWHKIAKTFTNHKSTKLESIVNYKSNHINIERPNSTFNAPNSPKLGLTTRCISEPPLSAFLPYKKQIEISTHETIQPLNLSISHESMPCNIPQNSLINNFLELRLTKSLEELSSNYAADVELFASNWGKMKQGHLCVYCGKIYSRKYGLKIHIRTHTGYKPLKCKYCQRPFGDPSNLNKHVRLHASGATPYMCSLCGKVLVRRRDLERHMKSQHSGEDACSSDDNDVNIDE